MNLDKEMQAKLQEMQIIEQNLQNLLMQKQQFQFELSESTSAIDEVKKSSDDVFKVVGQVMIKAKKSDVEKELEDKINLFNLRLKSIDKQEDLLRKKFEELQTEISGKLNKE